MTHMTALQAGINISILEAPYGTNYKKGNFILSYFIQGSL